MIVKWHWWLVWKQQIAHKVERCYPQISGPFWEQFLNDWMYEFLAILARIAASSRPVWFTSEAKGPVPVTGFFKEIALLGFICKFSRSCWQSSKASSGLSNSCGAPTSTIRPPSITTRRSLSMTVCNRWATVRTVHDANWLRIVFWIAKSVLQVK